MSDRLRWYAKAAVCAIFGHPGFQGDPDYTTLYCVRCERRMPLDWPN